MQYKEENMKTGSKITIERFLTKEEGSAAGAYRLYLRAYPSDPWGTHTALWNGWVRSRVSDGKALYQ
jgi:hypothetical protein